MRTEEDALGPVEVPDDAYYGAFTARARKNFQLTGETPPRAFIRAFGHVKQAAARANAELDVLDTGTADAIDEAAGAVADGEFDEAFVLDMVQAGAGTPHHMNANEVIANRATELLGGEKGEYAVDPHDDVNAGQSSNNVVPTAVRLATLDLHDALLEAVDAAVGALRDRADEAEAVKVGRTHLQDAVPLTVGQELGAMATNLETGAERLDEAADELLAVGLGGNAIGTGINTPPAFRETVVEELAAVTGRDLAPAEDAVAATRSMAPFAHYAGTLDALLADLLQVLDDLMLLNSGPVAGIGELELPAVEEGSSIMPGKVNPSIVEAAKMAVMQAQGDLSVVRHAAEEGDLELNVNAPLIGHSLFDALDLLREALTMLDERCLQDLTVDADRVQDLFTGSTATATALAPYLGYDRTAAVVQAALDEDVPLREAVRERGWMTDDELDRVLDPETMTRPGGVDEELQERVQERLSAG